MSKPDAICWLDLETTGTDETRDAILEVGVIVTDWALRVLGEWERVVRPEDEHWIELLDPTVLEMHAGSGLLRAVRDSHHAIQTVDSDLSTWLYQYGGSKHVALAGSGVAHFDRRFIQAYMPGTNRKLTYWSLDVVVMRRFCTMLCNLYLPDDPNAKKPHRALEDARLHLAEAVAWRKLLLGTTLAD